MYAGQDVPALRCRYGEIWLPPLIEAHAGNSRADPRDRGQQ